MQGDATREAIWRALDESDGGMSAKDLAEKLGLTQQWVISRMRLMDVHVDRYEKRSKTGRLVAIWKLGVNKSEPYPELARETVRRKMLHLKDMVTR